MDLVDLLNEKGINYKKCVYCQKTGYLHKIKNYCCFKISVPI